MKLDHVGIAVRSIAEAEAFYLKTLGLKSTHREDVAAQKVRVSFLEAGGTSLELLEPMDDSGAIAKFLKERGPGLHHMAFQVADIAGEMSRLKDSGIPSIEAAPRPGARGHKVCFFHPRHTGGVLLELVG